MKTIMQDIAKIAGVSPGTVSNALNDRKGVGKDTKAKIIKIAEEMGYFKTNKKGDGKSIKLIKFKRHGHVVSDTPFFSSLIEGCEEECRKNGYELLISQIDGYKNIKEELNRILSNHKVDGILLLATEMYEEDLECFKECSIPIVIIDSYFKEKDYDNVSINNTKGAFLATKYLIDNGHKNIGLLGSSVDIKNFNYRCEGFRKTLKSFDINYEEKNSIFIDPTMEGSYTEMSKYLNERKEKLPTAFFALNDIIALGAMKAMMENGIRIPEDVSVVGFDDILFSSFSNPALTTIKVSSKEMGVISVRRIMEKIETDLDVVLKVEINTELIERQSVKSLI